MTDRKPELDNQDKHPDDRWEDALLKGVQGSPQPQPKPPPEPEQAERLGQES